MVDRVRKQSWGALQTSPILLGFINYFYRNVTCSASRVAQWWRSHWSMQEMQKIQIQSLGGEDSPGGENGHPLQYSRCKVPRAEEPDGLHRVVKSDMTEHARAQRVGGAASLQLAGFPPGAHTVSRTCPRSSSAVRYPSQPLLHFMVRRTPHEPLSPPVSLQLSELVWWNSMICSLFVRVGFFFFHLILKVHLLKLSKRVSFK